MGGLNVYMNSMVKGGTKLGSVLIAEKVSLEMKVADLEKQIKALETLGEAQEKKYSEVYGRKDHYKAKFWELEKKMKEMKEETDTEKEKLTSEYEMEKSQRLRLIVDINAVEEALEEMKERNEVLLEKSKKTKKDHEEEIEKMKRRYEAQSNSEGEKLTEAKNKIGSLETEGKKARSH